MIQKYTEQIIQQRKKLLKKVKQDEQLEKTHKRIT